MISLCWCRLFFFCNGTASFLPPLTRLVNTNVEALHIMASLVRRSNSNICLFISAMCQNLVDIDANAILKTRDREFGRISTKLTIPPATCPVQGVDREVPGFLWESPVWLEMAKLFHLWCLTFLPVFFIINLYAQISSVFTTKFEEFLVQYVHDDY